MVGRGMKNITINIPDLYDKNIQKLIIAGYVANRSEGVRTALRDFLKKETNFFEELKGDELNENSDS